LLRNFYIQFQQTCLSYLPHFPFDIREDSHEDLHSKAKWEFRLFIAYWSSVEGRQAACNIFALRECVYYSYWRWNLPAQTSTLLLKYWRIQTSKLQMSSSEFCNNKATFEHRSPWCFTNRHSMQMCYRAVAYLDTNHNYDYLRSITTTFYDITGSGLLAEYLISQSLA
jgi:hypothetical protein